jgi:hypothetical protein
MPTRFALLVGGLLLMWGTQAHAREIHLDCARANQTVLLDADTDRRFLQLMWGEGVAEEFKDGDSYISGPDSHGRKEKVVYMVNIDGALITFGQDRLCIESGAKTCVDQKSRNTLDEAKGELKYEDGEEIAVLKCAPAPPGRRF